MPAHHLLRVALVAAMAALCACGDGSTSVGDVAGDAAASGKSAPAGADAASDALCEHKVLAAACPKCNPKLEAIYRAKGDWCGEHGFAESFCPICHPKLGGRPQPIDVEAKARAKADDARSKAPANGMSVKLKSRAVLDGMGLTTTRATPSTDGAKLNVPARLAYDGTKTAEINARSPGVVRKVLVDLGMPVKKGDTLVIVESAGVGADRARLVAAQKRLAVADQQVARIAVLERDGSASRKQSLEAERDLEDARADVGALSSGLMVLGAGAGGGSSYPLTSPIDGVVAKRAVAMGALVGPEEILFQIVDARTLWAELDVPEADIGQLAVGAAIVVTFAALPGESFGAAVASLAPEVDAHTRTAIARASLDNSGGRLRANMFGSAAVLGKAPVDAVTVPSAAVQTAGIPFVFVRESELSFAVRHVTVAQRRGAESVLSEGLKSGEEVVTTGAFLLKTETSKDSIGAGCCTVD